MKFKLGHATPASTLPEGFYYVSQDNFYIANLNDPNRDLPEKYLYSDSATSCIIIIIEGKNHENDPIVAVTHLSRQQRFLEFFRLVDRYFSGPASVFAQGANPPGAEASVSNTATLLNWVMANSRERYESCPQVSRPAWYIEQLTLSLGLGDPLVDDRSCYGIDLETMTVSNQSFTLTDLQRDPDDGLQTLFCVFGLKISPQAVLHHTGSPFPQDQVDLLVKQAKAEQWESILFMTRDEVLNKYSSTPQYEVPWFFSSLRQSAMFVKNHQP